VTSTPIDGRRRQEGVEADEDRDPAERTAQWSGTDDARVLVDFGAGSAGVGPAVGFDSGEFYPTAPAGGAEDDRPVDVRDEGEPDHHG
jgi:hypothetical protein